MGYVLGVDVGGTFTDCLAKDEATGSELWAKVPSTPPDFVDGVIAGILATGVPPGEVVASFVHGTTIGINAVIERKCPPAALLCTSGFRDFLEIRRSRREHLYDIWWAKPTSLIPRALRIGVPERIDYAGNELRPVEEDAVRSAVRDARSKGVVTYAVATLFSFINPTHEQQIANIVREEDPTAFVSLSSEVAPIIREYDRTVTTVINALLQPIMATYISKLEQALDGLGIKGPLYLMRSSGGACDAEEARQRPVTLLEGGHAAGAELAAHVGLVASTPNVAVYDGGGTTATLTLVEDNHPVLASRLDLEFDVYVASPAVAAKSIGQGGGAIAWVDRGGALQIGPRSSGADPGPACYGRGGTDPTVTDALVILGILDPDWDWIRNKPWDRTAAAQALESEVGKVYGWNAEQTAIAIHKLAVANVSALLREGMIEQGRDPRDFALVAIGGSGPMFAPLVAEDQNISKVIVPAALGIASALGLVLSNLRYDYALSRLMLVEDANQEQLLALFSDLTESFASVRRKWSALPVGVTYAADLRYVGEHWELTMPLSIDASGPPSATAIRRSFHEEHQRLYGFARADQPVELVTARAAAVIATGRGLREQQGEHRNAEAALSTRPVTFDSEPVIATVYDFDRLCVGNTVMGPAVIRRRDGTVPIPPRWTARVDPYANLIMTRGGDA